MATPARKIEFKPAVREDVGLWIQLIGGSGSGKTYTAMRLASGIAGDRPFAVIDTENRRALHYADQFKFHHAELHPPFRPSAYAEAITAADEAGYPVIVIDSGSHVWAGEGGVLDWHEEILDRRAGDDWKRREVLKMTAWIEPKMDHKKMVQRLLQVKAHIILCLRAEEKVEMVKGKDGKMEVQKKQSLTGKDGWIPVCDKNLPFEATCSFLLLASEPGIPHPIKLQEQHKSIFLLGQHINEEAGTRLAAWAKGGESGAPAQAPKEASTDEQRGRALVEHVTKNEDGSGYSVVDGETTFSISKREGSNARCSCASRSAFCAHKWAVKLWVKAQKEAPALAPPLRPGDTPDHFEGGTGPDDDPEPPREGPSPAQSSYIDLRAALSDLGVDEQEIAARVKKLINKEPGADLNPEELAKANSALAHMIRERRAKSGGKK